MAPLLKICIVEDNDDLRESLVEVLEGLGHSVVGLSCAEDLDDAPANESFELLIADLNLPGEDGLALVGRLKRAQPGLRVIVMSTRTAVRDRVRGYDVGADLYLPKPVEEEEFLAAVRSMARQIRSQAVRVADEDKAHVMLDARTMQLRGQSGEALLTPVEVALLSALARAPGQRLEHWQLLATAGLDLDDEASKANLAVKMTRLRGKFDQVGCQGVALKSLRGSGYQLCVALEIR